VFSWLQPEDLLVIESSSEPVDGFRTSRDGRDSGGLRINPPATAIAHFRNARR
jgi:hypothetical protein